MTGYSDSPARKGRIISLEKQGLIVSYKSSALPDEYEIVWANEDGKYHWIEPNYESTHEIRRGFDTSQEAEDSCMRYIDRATQDESNGTQQ
ncbi:hypothetical protein ACFLS0_04840 [Candidatus Bipolaricaulota bacterium]